MNHKYMRTGVNDFTYIFQLSTYTINSDGQTLILHVIQSYMKLQSLING